MEGGQGGASGNEDITENNGEITESNGSYEQVQEISEPQPDKSVEETVEGEKILY